MRTIKMIKCPKCTWPAEFKMKSDFSTMKIQVLIRCTFCTHTETHTEDLFEFKKAIDQAFLLGD